jgi:nicotinamidase/pyrazinamidase
VSALLAPSAGDVLLVVDVQNDFCPGGSLPVPGGDEIVPVINRLAQQFTDVVLTQDWHPRGHASFASTHPERIAFEQIETAHGPHVLWPDHCVQGTRGADFHRDLYIPHAALIIRKGIHRGIDSYSAFRENDRATPTGLAGYLRERGFTRVVVVGLALDFCVRFSAEDAIRNGFSVVVLENACRAIDVDHSLAAARKAFADRGIACLPEFAET